MAYNSYRGSGQNQYGVMTDLDQRAAQINNVNAAGRAQANDRSGQDWMLQQALRARAQQGQQAMAQAAPGDGMSDRMWADYRQKGRETTDRDTRDFAEDRRRWDINSGEDTRRWDLNAGEDTRRWDINSGEDTRRWDLNRGDTRSDVDWKRGDEVFQRDFDATKLFMDEIIRQGRVKEAAQLWDNLRATRSNGTPSPWAGVDVFQPQTMDRAMMNPVAQESALNLTTRAPQIAKALELSGASDEEIATAAQDLILQYMKSMYGAGGMQGRPDAPIKAAAISALAAALAPAGKVGKRMVEIIQAQGAGFTPGPAPLKPVQSMQMPFGITVPGSEFR